MSRILLVEDEAIIALAEAKGLENKGFEVVRVSTGESAVETLKSGKGAIDLILMDLDLGRGMDGAQAASEILQDHDIPIVFLSSHAEKDIVERAEKIASYGYVLKSSGITILAAAIRMAFQLHAAHRELRQKSRELESVNSRLCATIEELQATSEEFENANTDLIATCRELQDSDNALRTSEHRYHSLFRNMIDGFAYCRMIYDVEGRPIDWIYLEVNEAFARLTGLRPRSGEPVSSLIPGLLETDPNLLEIYGRVTRSGEPERFEMNVKALDQWFSVSVFSPEKGCFVAVFEVISERKRTERALRESEAKLTNDMVEQKLAEQKLAKSLAEKDVLLKELQHRVKNNLGVVSSLLTLSLVNVHDEASRQVLVDARARVHAMADIYETLMQSEGIDRINLDRYLGRFIDSLYEGYGIDREKMRFETRLETSDLDLKRAVSLCLILNELVTNSLKHAYPPGAPGEIRIELLKSDGGLELRVSDRGRGLPAGFDADSAQSMGFTLMRLLAGQLEGSLRVESEAGQGTSAALSFNE